MYPMVVAIAIKSMIEYYWNGINKYGQQFGINKDDRTVVGKYTFYIEQSLVKMRKHK
jgi:hypothetical protein